MFKISDEVTSKLTGLNGVVIEVNEEVKTAMYQGKDFINTASWNDLMLIKTAEIAEEGSAKLYPLPDFFSMPKHKSQEN